MPPSLGEGAVGACCCFVASLLAPVGGASLPCRVGCAVRSSLPSLPQFLGSRRRAGWGRSRLGCLRMANRPKAGRPSPLPRSGGGVTSVGCGPYVGKRDLTSCLMEVGAPPHWLPMRGGVALEPGQCGGRRLPVVMATLSWREDPRRAMVPCGTSPCR